MTIRDHWPFALVALLLLALVVLASIPPTGGAARPLHDPATPTQGGAD